MPTSPTATALAENILVTAHVLGHADFSRNNLLFRRCQEQVSEHIVEHAAQHARQISQAIETHGAQRVEAVLDAALALEQHIDVDQALRRERYPEYLRGAQGPGRRRVPASRFASLEPRGRRRPSRVKKRAPVPPHPERDLLWFIANYAPDMESWERDIFLAVREESFYFYPVFATQIMNEGWASYWHARLLREADFVPQQAYLDAIKCHSDVVRPVAAEQQVALSINPYHLGFCMWEKIVERDGLEAARSIMQQDDDFGFVRNHLTRELAEELGLFRYSARSDGQVQGARARPECSARGRARPQVQLRRADGRGGRRSAMTAHSSWCTTAVWTAAGWTSSAVARCSTTCTRSGAVRSS